MGSAIKNNDTIHLFQYFQIRTSVFAARWRVFFVFSQ